MERKEDERDERDDEMKFNRLLNIPRTCLKMTHRGRRYDMQIARQLNILERHFEAIREEAVKCLKDYPVLSYVRHRDFDVNSAKLPEKVGWVKSWPVPPSKTVTKHDFGLIVNNMTVELNAKVCPKTMDVLCNKMKNVSVAGFSWLLPNATLSRHVDRTFQSYTAHLGLIIPDSESNPLIVYDVQSDDPSVVSRTDLDIKETIYQKEGVAFSFDDSYLHETHNRTLKNRVILYLNIDIEDYF